jgi:hypothetical protein
MLSITILNTRNIIKFNVTFENKKLYGNCNFESSINHVINRDSYKKEGFHTWRELSLLFLISALQFPRKRS